MKLIVNVLKIPRRQSRWRFTSDGFQYQTRKQDQYDADWSED